MNEPPQLLRPKRHTSGGNASPTRQPRIVDDVLAHITPASAVDALSSPNEALRRCLSDAGPLEREFALRTAAAARRIWEWVDELDDWDWPDDGGSQGFERPGGKVRPLTMEVTPPKDEEYIGSLLEEDVARYESAIEQIQRDLKRLDVEGIKSHILTNHILPLSRPATPVSDDGRVSGFNRMEDLTAVVTAIIVQTLPLLARLNGLLNVWGIRILVLRRIPGLESAIEDAEVALKSGWMAISSTKDSGQKVTLSRKDFSVMKTVVEKKVVVPGRTLDFMLDRLEGLADTLPEVWLDRMEAVEQGYAEWVAACERKIRETEWTRASRSNASRSPSPAKTVEEETKRPLGPVAGNTVALPAPIRPDNAEEPSKQRRDSRRVSHPIDEENITPPSSSPSGELPELRISTDHEIGLDGAYDLPAAKIRVPTPIKEESSPSPERTRRNWNIDEDICTPVSPGSEPELPPMPVDRPASDASEVDTSFLPGASSDFGMLSDPPEVSASPEIARARVRQAEYAGATPEASPPSSPPVPEADTRESSLMPETRESSMVPLTRESSLAPESFSRSITAETEVGDDSTLPRTPLEGSFSEYFDDSFTTSEVVASPSVRRDSTGDQHLRQQISDIIDNIPAKIKLSAEPPNLNPPDLQLPRLRKKPSKEPVKRSVSSMSSMSNRTATPSFTLSPAKNARPQRTRGQQEIKVYHLSRSTGEAPIKLFIRCVGENGERVMVRVGGGWADLSEYLKEYASHHGRRSKGKNSAKIEVSDAPRASLPRSSPSSRPASAMETSPLTPLTVRKTRRSGSAMGSERPRTLRPNTPAPPQPSRGADELIPSSEERTTRSRSSSRLSWKEEDSSFLGLAGPSGKKAELSDEGKAWVESVKEKVRMASGERKISNPPPPPPDEYNRNKFGELGRVGGTKRLFRRADGTIQGQKEGKGSR